MKKRIEAALHNAGTETSHYLTAHLRAETHASEWPTHITNSVRVKHSNGSFSIHVPDAHKEEALDYEYGTPNSRPTAAVRRFNNRTSEAEKVFASRFLKHLGVK